MDLTWMQFVAACGQNPVADSVKIKSKDLVTASKLAKEYRKMRLDSKFKTVFGKIPEK